MAIVLRQSSSSDVLIGPFVDSTDGNTVEDGLTIDAADIRLSKNGANIVAKNSGGGTHDELGYYTITLDATDTGTVGRLQLMVHESGALPVYHEYQVVEEVIYDALFASGAARVPADTTHIAGNAVSTSTAQIGVNVVNAAGTAWASGAITAAVIAADAIGSSELATSAVDEIVDAVWDEVLSGATHNVASSAGRRLRTLQDVGNYFGGAVWLNTNSANTGSTFPDDGTFLNPVNTLARAGTVAAAATQPLKRLQILPGSSLTLATTYDGWTFEGDSYALALGGQDISNSIFRHSNAVSGTGTGTFPLFQECTIGDVTLPPCIMIDVGMTGTLTMGSAGEFLIIRGNDADATGGTVIIDFAAVGGSSVSLREFHGGVEIHNMGASDFLSIDGIGRLVIDSTCTAGEVRVRGAFDVTNNGSGQTVFQTANYTASNVNAEVVDALATDTYAEPTGVPPATDTLAGKIGRLHMALRNRVDVTASKKTFYDDGGAAEWEQDLSDDGTTYSQSEANAV